MKQVQKMLDSREVAEMTGKQHKNLIRDIKLYIDELAELKIEPGDFFQETTYKDRNSQSRPCYLVTKKGCEFIAHKLTGIKGTEFTAKYINRFHEMEEVIQNHIPQGQELIALAVLEANKLLEEQRVQIEEMKPKALFADAVSASKTSILIGELAKILKQNDVNIGQNRLFAWMRDKGYLIKSGERYNQPTQYSMERGLFELKERVVTNPDGSIRMTITTKVTGKGQQYFINLFLKNNVA